MEAIATQADRSQSAVKALIGLLLGITLAYLVGAFATTLLVPWLQDSGGFLEKHLLRKGPHRLMLRLSMVSLVLFLPLILRFIGWRGRNDLGLAPDHQSWSTAQALRDMGTGMGVGIISLGLAIATMLAMGTRVMEAHLTASELISALLSVTISCIVVAALEETIARGIFFRSLARAWTPLRAGVVLSVLFALAHFLRPLPEAFYDGPVLNVTFEVLASMVRGFAQTEHVAIRTLNITLMSLVLCAFVHRTGTIWLAVGAHAAWVWVKRMNGKLTDSVADVTAAAGLVGHKSDATDAPLATVILLTLLAWAFISIKARKA